MVDLKVLLALVALSFVGIENVKRVVHLFLVLAHQPAAYV